MEPTTAPVSPTVTPAVSPPTTPTPEATPSVPVVPPAPIAASAPPPLPASPPVPPTPPAIPKRIPVNIPVLIVGGLFLFAVAVIGFMTFQNSKLQREVTDLKTPKPTPTKAVPTATPTPIDPKANWKTYQGSNFSIKYPPTAMGKSGASVSCGNAVVTTGQQLSFENFFVMNQISWTKSIREYIASLGEAGTFNLFAVTIPGADDAVQVGTQLKTPKRPWTLNYLFKKGNQLLTFASKTPVGDGCLPDQLWKLEENFSFTVSTSAATQK